MGIKERVLDAVASAAGRTLDDAYVSDPRDNFVGSLSDQQVAIVLEQIDCGDGGELKAKDGLIKFGAAHSSSALAANAFGPWFEQPESLVIGGMSSFDSIELERKFPTGLGGNSPNLDLFLSSPANPVAIESKFTEYLGRKAAGFSDSYEPLVAKIADPSWRSLFEELRVKPRLYEQIDVAQLVKHYLGLKSAVEAGQFRQLTLLYLYWEPSNADEIGEIVAHRKQLEEITGRVDDQTVRFKSLTYPELWGEWAGLDRPNWLKHHVNELRSRYEVRV